MATIVNLTLKKSGYVKSSSANTVFPTNTTSWYQVSARDLMFFGFNAMPANLKRKKLQSVRLRANLRNVSNDGYDAGIDFGFYGIRSDFDPASLTYNNRPDETYIKYRATVPVGSGDYWTEYLSTDESKECAVRYGVEIEGTVYSFANTYVKTRLSGGGLPYLEVTYDESVNVTSKVSNVTKSPSGAQNPGQDATFSWDLVPDSSIGVCADETYTQASAKFFWRVSGASSWNEINISGSTQRVTVPAQTFPPSATVQYYVQATDTDGTTSSSSTYSFTTSAATITLSNRPSGTSYDTRPARVLTWTLKTGSYDYPQASATYYWRKSGESAWHSITVTGNAKSLTIPANTFPTGSTIEQYFTCTPVNASAITLQTSTFTTPTTKITATVYPSGRDVESGGPLTFSWVFRNTLGDYGQSNATLYWRASTSDPWSAIQASGSEQSIAVPKNTFPGNASTVYWYLEGTDIGGTTSSTSEQNFRTVTSQITPQGSPTSGYADPRDPITFSWYFATPAGSYDQESATFYWRLQGEETWTAVQASGSTGSVTIPANTFPTAATVEWYVTGTDAGGCSSTSTVYSFSTAASLTNAIPVSPVGRVEDGTKPITFTWIVRNSDGSDPSRTILRWKLPTESQSEWHTLIDTADPITEYTVPADTYDAGPVEWRVQAYNRDSVAGPAGEASFVVLRAPEPPKGLTGTSVPRTEIRWQSTGQEGYEISIDGEVVASAYGPATYSWQQLIPLADGPHQIKVRIQGSYELWSNYAETSILVQNVPEGTLTLAGTFGTDALLQASGEIDADTEIQWYRDGVRIGRTVGLDQFTDRFALGEHSYYAEIWHASGNYTRSNAVTGTMSTGSPLIAAAEGGAWLSLRLSANSRREQDFNWERSSALTHISGTTFPALDFAPYEDLSGSYDCAFRSQTEAAAFEALRGKVVILKSRDGHVLVGGFTQFRRRVNLFYTAYTFGLQQINWEDFVDDAPND